MQYRFTDTDLRTKIFGKEWNTFEISEYTDLSDLLNYYIKLEEIDEEHRRSIIDIRNKIAHSVDIISQEKNEDAEHLYDFKGLEKFVKDAINFFESYELLEEKVKEKYLS